MNIHVIDVGKLTRKEICHLLDIRFIPWYRSVLFWTILIALSMPNMLFLYITL